MQSNVFSFHRLIHKIKILFRISPKVKYLKEFSIHYFGGLFIRMDTHHIFLFASGLAFSLFLCIIPFVLILFWILGNMLNSNLVLLQLNIFIDTVIPYKDYADYVKNILMPKIYEIVKFKDIAGFIGIIGLFFAASSFSSSIRTVLNKVFGKDSDVNLFLGKLRDFALILFVILVFLISILLFPMIDVLRNASEKIFFFEFLNYGIFQKASTTAISVFILFLIFATIYKFVPNVKINRKAIFVGAAWAAILWESAKQIFGYYIYNIASLGKIYGTYTFIIVVAFWIYYSSIVFIIGAEIGQLFDERIKRKK